MTQKNFLNQSRLCSVGTGVLLAGMLAGGIFVSTSPAQSATPAQSAAPVPPPGTPAAKPAPVWRGAQTNHFSSRAEMYYEGDLGCWRTPR